MQHVVMFSAGGGSWKTARRVAERHGVENLTLLFTDTMFESWDTYRFLIEGAADVFGVALPKAAIPEQADFPDFKDRAAYKAFLTELRLQTEPLLPRLKWIADGRDIWDVFRDERFLGNSGVDPCSKILKRQLADKWMKNNLDPKDSTIYVGIDWTEKHRFDDGNGRGVRPRRAADGWTYEAPLTEPPYIWKPDMIAEMRQRGITPPVAYEQGFSHNNCRKFCIKAGHEHYENLLRKDRDSYLYYEQLEEELRQFLNADVSILTDRSGDNKKKVMTLRMFRERIESNPQMGFLFSEEFAVREGEGGCGCMLESEDDDWTRALDERLAELVGQMGQADNAIKAIADEIGLAPEKIVRRMKDLNLAAADIDAVSAFAIPAPKALEIAAAK